MNETCNYHYPPTSPGGQGGYCRSEVEEPGDEYCSRHQAPCRKCGKVVMKDEHDDPDDVICWSCWKKEGEVQKILH